MAAHVGHVVVVHRQAVRNDLVPHLDGQFKEGLAVVLYSNLEGDLFKFFPGIELRDKLLPMVFRYAHLGVDALFGHVDAAKALQGVPLQKELIPNRLRIFEGYIAVKRHRSARKILRLEALHQGLAVVLVVQNGFRRLFGHTTKVQPPL